MQGILKLKNGKWVAVYTPPGMLTPRELPMHPRDVSLVCGLIENGSWIEFSEWSTPFGEDTTTYAKLTPMEQETYQDLEKRQTWSDLLVEFNKLNKPYSVDAFLSWLDKYYLTPIKK